MIFFPPRLLILSLLLTLFTGGAETLLAHREYVHQYLAIQAYHLLADRYPGLASSEFPLHLGTQGGDCSGFQFTGGTIATGAYREDCEDPVYHYGDVIPGLDLAYFSASHFWDADAGDASTIRICDITCGDYQNAFRKSLRYVLPGMYGRWTAKLTWPEGYSSFRLQSGETRAIFHGGLIGFEYDSLAQFYRDGRCTITGYLDYAGRWQTASTIPDRLPLKIIAPKDVRDRISWEVIGRIAHLLGDMGVPAHAHNDIHPPFWWVNEPADVFEEEMARMYTAWDADDAAIQGHLLDAREASPGGRAENAMRYLLYTTNQVADRFPSNDADGDLRYDLTWGGDDYSVLGIIGEITTDPSARDVFHREAAEYAFVFSIRAIAGLYHWFALETGLLGEVTVGADYPGAAVLINGKPAEAPAVITSAPGTMFTLYAGDQAAADPALNTFMLRFRDWDRHLPSAGRSLLPAARITEYSEDGATYTARFTKEVTVTLLEAVHPDGGSGGRYTVNGSDAGTSWSGPLNVTLTPAMTIGFIPPSGSLFLRWGDGVTANPRELRPVGDISLGAVCSKQAPTTTPPVLSGNVVVVGDVPRPRLVWTLPAGVPSSRLYRYICGDSAGCAIASGRPSLVYEGSGKVFTDGNVAVAPKSAGGRRAYYFVRGTGQGFTTLPSNTVSFSTNFDIQYSAAGPEGERPASGGLEPNYPNPFNPSTTIPYRVASDGRVNIAVYSIAGERVALLFEGYRAAGRYQAVWNASGRPSGVYIVTMETEDPVSSSVSRDRRKLVLMK